MKKIAIVVGSLRKGSFHRKLANELIRLAPTSLEMNIIDIGQLPLYNQDPDDEGTPHQAWLDFRQAIKQHHAVLFITPEYNRSVPGVLKNAIDVGSRPYGQSVWEKKPCAVISGSVGAVGGFGANQHLRQCFVFLDMPCMQQPEAYIGNMGQLFDENNYILKEDTKVFLQKYLTAFESWIRLF